MIHKKKILYRARPIYDPCPMRYHKLSVSIGQGILDTIIIQGVHQKLCFFPIHCNPPPACRRTTHPRKRSECTVTLFDWPFLYRQ